MNLGGPSRPSGLTEVLRHGALSRGTQPANCRETNNQMKTTQYEIGGLPFNLAGETTQDGERLAREEAARQRHQERAEARQGKLFGERDPAGWQCHSGAGKGAA